MGSFSLIHEGMTSSLVYKLDEEEQIDVMTKQMICTNRDIPGIAAAVYSQSNHDRMFYFSVTGKQPVEVLFRNQVSKKQMLGVLSGIVNALASVENYMLELDNLVLDTRYMFVDRYSGETVLVCLPVMMEKKEINIVRFIRNLLTEVEFDPNDDEKYVIELLNHLKKSNGLNLESLKELLLKLSAQKKPADAPSKDSERTTEKKVEERPVSPAHWEPPEATSGPKYTDLQFGPNYPKSTDPRGVNEEQQEEKKGCLFRLFRKKPKKEKKPKEKKQKEKKRKEKKQEEQTPMGYAVPGGAQVEYAVPNGQNQPPITRPEERKEEMPEVRKPIEKKEPDRSSGRYLPYLDPNDENFGRTIDLGSANLETMNLAMAQKKPINTEWPYLVHIRLNKKIPVNKSVFKIGRQYNEVDYAITDNAAVSRSHAAILCEEGRYYVVDLGSKYHVTVNGGLIEPNEKTAIAHGHHLSLADEEFEFRLY